MSNTLKDLESKLTPQQIKAAHLIIQNDFDKKPRTQQEIADEVGVGRNTLYAWRSRNPDFIEYSRLLTLTQLDGQLSFVGSKLMESIGRGHTKAIELYLKWRGELINQTEIRHLKSDESGKLSLEEMQMKLDEMHAKLH